MFRSDGRNLELVHGGRVFPFHAGTVNGKHEAIRLRMIEGFNMDNMGGSGFLVNENGRYHFNWDCPG